MYSEQIEAEKKGIWPTTYFTDTFYVDESSLKYVCPKIDTIKDA